MKELEELNEMHGSAGTPIQVSAPSANYNLGVFIGWCASEVLKEIDPHGEECVSFTLGVKKSSNKSNSSENNPNEYIHVRIYGKIAEIANNVLYKSKKLYVDGSIRYEEKGNGYLHCETIRFL